MGSFNIQCGISKQVILPGDKVVVIPIKFRGHGWVNRGSVNRYWNILGYSFTGIYDDYGYTILDTSDINIQGFNNMVSANPSWFKPGMMAEQWKLFNIDICEGLYADGTNYKIDIMIVLQSVYQYMVDNTVGQQNGLGECYLSVDDKVEQISNIVQCLHSWVFVDVNTDIVGAVPHWGYNILKQCKQIDKSLLKEVIRYWYFMISLSRINISIEPLCISGQDYTNESGIEYSRLVNVACGWRNEK